MTGIYKIENKINGKVYIGKSKNIKKRWTGHICELNKNYHHNIHLQSAWNKYGEDNFIFEVLEECTEDVLSEKEIYYIGLYNSTNDLYGYNLAKGGEGGNNLKNRLSEEEYKEYKEYVGKKISESFPRGEDHFYAKLTEIQVIEIINKLQSGMKPKNIARMYNVSTNTIQDIKMHRTWKHLTKDIVFNNANNANYKRNIDNWRRNIEQLKKDGTYIHTYTDANEASVVTGIPVKQIYNVCCGSKKSCHGYIFRYST